MIDLRDIGRRDIRRAFTDAGPDTANLTAMRLFCLKAEKVVRIVPRGLDGYWLVGGQLPLAGQVLSVTGTGTSLVEALIRMGGEVAEAVALTETEGEDQLIGHDLATGAPVTVLRADAFPDGGTFSRTGCAAGPGPDTAARAALMEAIERDAAAIWWEAGRPARVLELTPDFNAWCEAMGPLPDGRTWRALLLDDTFGAQVVAVCSVDAEGRGFCCGTAARPGLIPALKAAWREMCQMVIGLSLARLKAEALGDTALSDGDRRQLARADLPGNVLEGLWHDAPQRIERPGPDADMTGIIYALTSGGIGVTVLPLPSLHAGCAVARVHAPGLQAELSRIETIRFSRFKTEFGGGAGARTGCPLY